ncbi:MAG: response regulator transcription factor [Cyanosarcina radialis HA8281-LM2]|jgi:DNA-binding response OmpR family regulator|nr:response regulator transcription factor [Cyanosarcina radialis HA8281-LM2]
MSTLKKILLIEDNDMFRWRLLHFLESQGYSILEAEEGGKGIKLAQSDRPDLIMCDINMPRLNGYDVLKQLHKSQITASIPFIFLTNRGADECNIALQAGAKDYLSKALSFEQILERIRPHLRVVYIADILPQPDIFNAQIK